MDVPVSALDSTRRVPRAAKARAGTGDSPSLVVEFSSVVSAMRTEAGAHPYGEVRPQVVAQARADIAAGRLGTQEDLDRTVEALLGEL